MLRPLFFLFLLVAIACNAQDNPPTQNIVNANQLNVLLPAPPTPPQFVSASVVGNSGPQSYFYWVIARNTVANSGVSIPAQASFVANVLSSSAYVQVSWNAAQGATGYDVLRTNDATAPQGACNCAVATNVSGLTTNDQSNSLNSYTVTNLNPSTLGLSLQNIVISAGVSHLELFQGTVPNGPFTFVADLSLAGGGGVTFPLHGPNGTCAAPTYSFTNSTNTGITLNAVGDLATCAAGTRITDTTASGLTLNAGQLVVPNGNAGAPSITTSHGNGIYFTGTGISVNDAVDIVAGLGSDNFQVQGTRIKTFVPLSATSGSAASPTYAFQSAVSGTGMYYSFSGVVDQLNFSAGGSNYQTCQSGGFLNGQCSLIGNLIVNPSAPFVNTSNAIPLDITATWNNGATTFAGLIRANVTDTASAAGSLLLDLQVGGVSQFNVTKSGQVILVPGTVNNPSISNSISANSPGIYFPFGTFICLAQGASTVACADSSGFEVYGGQGLVISASAGGGPGHRLSYVSSTILGIAVGGQAVISTTWNSGGTTFPGVLVINPTNTASAAGSLLQDWQASGVSVASMDEAGNLIVASCTGCGGGGSFPLLANPTFGVNPPYSFSGDPTTGVDSYGAGTVAFVAAGINGLLVDSTTTPTLVQVGMIDFATNGHLSDNSGLPPAIASGFGTSPNISGADSVFTLTIGSGGTASTGTVTFNAQWNNLKVSCFPQSQTLADAGLITAPATTTQVVINKATPFTASSKVDVHCIGHD